MARHLPSASFLFPQQGMLTKRQYVVTGEKIAATVGEFRKSVFKTAECFCKFNNSSRLTTPNHQVLVQNKKEKRKKNKRNDRRVKWKISRLLFDPTNFRTLSFAHFRSHI